MKSPITMARAAPLLLCPEPPLETLGRRLSDAQRCSAAPLAEVQGQPATGDNSSTRTRNSRPERLIGTLEGVYAQLPELTYTAGRTLFRQGERADALFYINHGRLHRTTTTRTGDERLVAILGAGTFCGEECLTPKPYHRTSAVIVQDAKVTRIYRTSMPRLLQDFPDFSGALTKFLAMHSLKTELALIDQLIGYSVEQRVRHALLRLVDVEDQDGQVGVISNINQEMLAQLSGTTRPRANYFLNKFRRLGLIDYGSRFGPGVIRVRDSLKQAEIND